MDENQFDEDAEERHVMPQEMRNKVQQQPAISVNGRGKPASGGEKGEPKILFQKYFKSVGPRTYSGQIKEATNGNHVLVLTEQKRESGSEEVKKTKLFVFSEDFGTFFRMLHETAQWIRMNPVPEEVKKRRQRFWARQNAAAEAGGAPASGKTIAAPPPQARPARRNGNGASVPAAATSTKPVPVAAKAASVATPSSVVVGKSRYGSAKPGMNAGKAASVATPSSVVVGKSRYGSGKPGMNSGKAAGAARKTGGAVATKAPVKKAAARRGR